MENRILKALGQIEADEKVRILYAVESGSRAWGFASVNSDWDVRFIYIRRPEWYLSIQRRRDVLEFPIADDLDMSGWDLPKALGLFAKSNPPMLEWLHSPIVYKEQFSIAERLRGLMSEYFSPKSCLHHYLHMAQGNYKEYLQRDRVRTKKYFYVIRPILACRWISTHDTMPPTEFQRLVDDQFPKELMPILDDLMKRKKSGEELDDGPQIPEINAFIEKEMGRFEAALGESIPSKPVERDTLDRVFRETLNEVWGKVY